MKKSDIAEMSLPIISVSFLSLFLTGDIINSTGVLSGFIGGTVFAIIAAFLIPDLNNLTSDIIKTILSFLFLSVIIKVYLDFVLEKMLVLSFSPIIPLGFIVPLSYLAFSGHGVIKKGGFLAACVVNISAAFIFIMSLPQLRAETVFTVKEFYLPDFLKSFGVFFLISFIILFISKSTKIDKNFKNITYATLKILIIALLFCMLCIFLFGSDLSRKFAFPYFSAVNTINFGRLFSRIDEFGFLIYFLVSLFSAAVCLNNIADFFEDRLKKKRTLPIIITGVSEYLFYIILKFFNL